MTGKSQEPRDKDKTVYILGAGFSFLAGVPLMNDFADKVHSLAGGNLGESFHRLLGEISHIKESSDLDTTSLETIFCLFDSLSKDSASTSEEQRKILVHATIDTIHNSACYINGKHGDQRDCWVPQNCFYDKYKEQDKDKVQYLTRHKCNHSEKISHYGCCIYDAFFSHLFHQNNITGKSNVVISFNYDLLLEQFVFDQTRERKNKPDMKIYYDDILAKSCEAPNYIEKDKSSSDKTLHYIKLHGSFNWRSTINKDTPDEVSKITDVENSTVEDIEHIPLVLPTWRDKFKHGNVFQKLSERVHYHIHTATNIIIIGYSMPITDVYFKYLFLDGLCNTTSPNIEVWDVIKENVFYERLKKAFCLREGLLKKVKYNGGGLKRFVMSRLKKGD